VDASAARHSAETVTIGRPARGEGRADAGTDPTGKTERAPISAGLAGTPAEPHRAAVDGRPSGGTLVSSGAVSGDDGVTSRSAPTTESVAAVETTASAMRRRVRSQRVKVIAGGVLAAAVGLTALAFTRRSAGVHDLPGVSSEQPPARPAAALAQPGAQAAAPAPSHASGPDVSPAAHASAAPAASATEAEPPAKVTGADAGAPIRAVAPAANQRRAPGPAKSGGKLDRILGERD